MERESFCSPEVASLLNTSFIPIKLDRESRPDLDEIYMSYVTATTGSGGWPLNVFLTPDLQPVFGGTYWPGPLSTTSTPSDLTSDETPLNFLDILRKMRDVWTNQRARCLQSAADITEQLRAFAAEGTTHASTQVKGEDDSATDPPEPLDLDLLDDALTHFLSRYDSEYGGFSSAPSTPKFPTPANITFLLRIGASITFPSTHTRFGFPTPIPGILGKESCVQAASMALLTLMAMTRGGIRDQLGLGFHRYSVTSDWNLPHFEKMLYDNAQLLGCYCDAWALGRDPEILGTIYNLVEYLTNPDSPIVRPEGGWYSSEDADSRHNASPPIDGPEEEKREGAYYVWTLKELIAILGEHDAAVVARHFGVKKDGNVPHEHDPNDEFLNQNVLRVEATPSILAKEFGLPEIDIVRIIKKGRSKLAEYRSSKREKPQVDTKIITSWNALAVTALTKAANTLARIDKHRATRCRETATKAMNFIKKELYDESTGRLTRIYNPDSPTQTTTTPTAFVDDYAYMLQANVLLFDLTLDQTYLDWAVKLQSQLDEKFIADTTGAYFQAPRSPEQLMRLKLGSDNSLPSPNGIIANSLFYMASYLPEKQATYNEKARKILDAFAVEVIQYPFLYTTLLSSIVLDQAGVKTLIAPPTIRDSELRRIKGFGRTVVKGGDDVKVVMICTKEGVCRELRKGELEDGDLEDDDNTLQRLSTREQEVVSAHPTTSNEGSTTL